MSINQYVAGLVRWKVCGGDVEPVVPKDIMDVVIETVRERVVVP